MKTLASETPKERFQGIPGMLTTHRQFYDSVESLIFLDVAMLEYVRSLARGGDAAANHWKMVGATEFIKELLKLSEQGVATRNTDTNNLNHRA